MKIKIKTKPEDFVVEEMVNLPLKKNGQFAVYLLQKKGWNTVGILLLLSQEIGIPFGCFSYGGKKDRYALTSQYITIKAPRIKDIEGQDYSLKFCGFMERPMGPDLIEGNAFQIIVRDLKQTDALYADSQIDSVQSLGYANYFDEQRLGSYDPLQGYFAEKILKGHLNGALKIYLTSIYRSDDKQEKERKQFFLSNWGDWQRCYIFAAAPLEKQAFGFLQNNPKDFMQIVKNIPRERLSIYFSAYQAHLWNEVVRRVLKIRVDLPLLSYHGKVEDFLFFKNLPNDAFGYLLGLKIPTIAGNFKVSDPIVKQVYDEVIQEHGIKRTMFNKIKVRKVYFKSIQREAIVKPDNLSITISADELHKGKKKMSLGFSLMRGSYGTMLLKRLFCQ